MKKIKKLIKQNKKIVLLPVILAFTSLLFVYQSNTNINNIWMQLLNPESEQILNPLNGVTEPEGWDITEYNGYRIHTFRTSWQKFKAYEAMNVEVLVVGWWGWGKKGKYAWWWGGGWQVTHNPSQSISANTDYNITIWAGWSSGEKGWDSDFAGIMSAIGWGPGCGGGDWVNGGGACPTNASPPRWCTPSPDLPSEWWNRGWRGMEEDYKWSGGWGWGAGWDWADNRFCGGWDPGAAGGIWRQYSTSWSNAYYGGWGWGTHEPNPKAWPGGLGWGWDWQSPWEANRGWWWWWNDQSGWAGVVIIKYTIPPTAPVASNVSISWDLTATWNPVTWTYTYLDRNGDADNWTYFRWFRSDNPSWTDPVLITWATSRIYNITQEDNQYYLILEVTPRNPNWPTEWLPVMSNVSAKVNIATAPVATNVSITWSTNAIWNILTASYDYYDANWDPKSTSEYKWYRSYDPAGTNPELIAWANWITYTITDQDNRKYISFEVIPKNNTAPTAWEAVRSTENLLISIPVPPVILCDITEWNNPNNQNASWALVYYSSNFTWSFNLNAKPQSVSCFDILTNNPWSPDWDYMIDPDGPGWVPEFSAYCDMTTDWWWWTRVIYEDFETWTTWWSTTNNTSDCWGDWKVLWGINIISNAENSKTYGLLSVGHSELKVKLDYFRMDSWDTGEQWYIKIDWEEIYRGSPWGSPANCAGGSGDGKSFISSDIINHSSNSVNLLWGSTLNSPPNDESWGFDNIEIYVRWTSPSGGIDGIEKLTFPSLSWFNWWGDVLTLPGSSEYTWGSLSTVSPWEIEVIALSENGLTWTCSLSIINDAAGPTWWFINYDSIYLTSLDEKASVTVDDWSDTPSWIYTTWSLLVKKEGTLSWAACNNYGSFAQTTYTWTYPNFEDTWEIFEDKCYQYWWKTVDNLWNETIYVSANEFRVQITKPTIRITSVSEAEDNIYITWSTTIYYKPPSSTIQFTIETLANDIKSWVKKILFKSIGSWFSDDQEYSYTPETDITQSHTYSIYGGTYSSKTWNIIQLTNDAGITGQTTFDITVDRTGPVWVSISCPSVYDLDWTYTISWNVWTDTWAWLNVAIGLIEKNVWILNEDECTFENDFANASEPWATTFWEANLENWCYSYLYRSEDLVSNSSTTDACTMKIDNTDPMVPTYELVEDTIYTYYTWSTFYYSNSKNVVSPFSINLITWDEDTGIKSVSGSSAFWESPLLNNGTRIGETHNFSYSFPYSIEQWSSCPGNQLSITAKNKAWRKAIKPFDCTMDNQPPINWSIDYHNWYNSSWIIAIDIQTWNDLLSGMNNHDENYFLEYKRSTYSGDNCWTYWTWTDANVNETTVWSKYIYTGENWYCYMFRYKIKDNVWNDIILTSNNVTKVDTTNPIMEIVNIESDSPHVFITWGIIYYTNYFENKQFSTWTINISLQASDLESTINNASGTHAFLDNPIDYTWEMLGNSITWEYLITYSVDTGSVCTWNVLTISVTNNAWLITSKNIDCIIDNNPPVSSINIYNQMARNSNVVLNLEYSDNISGLNLCRYANEDYKWTPWQQCTPTMDWMLTETRWIRTVYYEVRDMVKNISRITGNTQSNVPGAVEASNYSSDWWWGWGGGWGWGDALDVWRSITEQTYLVPMWLNKSKIEVSKNINLKSLKSWVVNTPITMKHPSHNYSVTIDKDTKVLKSDWTIFSWIIKNIEINRIKNLPNIDWDATPLRSISVGDSKWNKLIFSKPITVTLSTEWLSKKNRKSDLKVYSYNERTKQYNIENENIKIDRKNDTISVDVPHLTTFVLFHWNKLRWSADEAWKMISFKDISNHWSKPYIEKLFNLWVLKNNKKFYPNNYLTRAELLKIALETYDHEPLKDLSEVVFDDTDKKQWYAPYLAKAIELWIVDWVIKTKADFGYLKSKHDIKNTQKVLKFLWYDIEYTKKNDDQTMVALKKYQKDRWLTNPLWKVWDWTFEQLNNEPSVVKVLSHQAWMIHDNKFFRPQDVVNRAEAMKIMTKASWLKPIPWKNQIFKDVNKGTWYSEFVNTAALNWIISWYWNWSFGPWDNVTRWQISKIAIKAYEI